MEIWDKNRVESKKTMQHEHALLIYLLSKAKTLGFIVIIFQNINNNVA